MRHREREREGENKCCWKENGKPETWEERDIGGRKRQRDRDRQDEAETKTEKEQYTHRGEEMEKEPATDRAAHRELRTPQGAGDRQGLTHSETNRDSWRG